MKYFSRLFSSQLVFKGDGISEATAAEDSLQETELRAKKRQGKTLSVVFFLFQSTICCSNRGSL